MSELILFLMLISPALMFGIGDFILDVLLPYLRRNKDEEKKAWMQ
jgi:hypothetical protein